MWQAVRPFSRALSVHQGKGATDDAARLGAVMEAIECHHAERWSPRTPCLRASWSALPPSSRSGAADDFASARGGVDPHAAIDWVLAKPLGGNAAFYVPYSCVTLDCTASLPAGLARDSNGQAAHVALEPAILAALLELIERDAVAEWLAGTPVTRCAAEIDLSTVAHPALQQIVARLDAGRITLRVYRLRAVVPAPAVFAEIARPVRDGAPHEAAWGSAASLHPADAVFRAVAEALQTRCTEIAGARDTIPMGEDDPGAIRGAIASTRWPGWRGHPFDSASSPIDDVDGLVAALIAAGRGQVGYVLLSPPESAAITVKAFVPGLGFEGRRRRRS